MRIYVENLENTYILNIIIYRIKKRHLTQKLLVEITQKFDDIIKSTSTQPFGRPMTQPTIKVPPLIKHATKIFLIKISL